MSRPDPDDCAHERTVPLPDGGFECDRCGQPFGRPTPRPVRSVPLPDRAARERGLAHVRALREQLRQDPKAGA